MTRETINQFKEKLMLWALPLIIGLLTWIVVTSYENKSAIKVMEVQEVNQDKMLEKMWVKIQENNVILYSKADQVQNETDHNMIMIKLDEMENALVKSGLATKTTELYPLDSIIGGKPMSFLHAVVESNVN
jgi:hypothetical protein